MRTWLAAIGAVAIILLLFLVSAGLHLLSRMGPLTDEAKAFADETIIAIATDWQVQAMLDHAAPEFIQATTPEQLAAFTEHLRSDIGVLTAYGDGAVCQLAEQHYSLNRDRYVRSVCYAIIGTEKAEAKIKLPIIKRHGQWAMLGFHVEEVDYEENFEPLAMVVNTPWMPNVMINFGELSLSLQHQPEAPLNGNALIPANAR